MENIEIKAKCENPEELHMKLIELGADFKGMDHQVDTYFKVNHGRLKLREGNIETALISYNRPDTPTAKKSEFRLYHSCDYVSLKAMLTESLGVLTIVDKKRKIFYIDHIKFHIDEVAKLGSFMEIEVTNMDGNQIPELMHKQCSEFMKLLSISEKDLVSNSYSDMILKNK
jgi:predicted adenylyl cyclase CyaB